MNRPRRLVLMRIPSKEDARRLASEHQSFEAIPGVSCLAAASPASAVNGEAPFTHVSVFEFADSAARIAYHDHPLHTSARPRVRAWATEVVVLDLD